MIASTGWKTSDSALRKYVFRWKNCLNNKTKIVFSEMLNPCRSDDYFLYKQVVTQTKIILMNWYETTHTRPYITAEPSLITINASLLPLDIKLNKKLLSRHSLVWYHRLFVVILCHCNSISVISWWWYDLLDEEKPQAYTLTNSRAHIGMVWGELAFDDAVNYTQRGNGLQDN